MYELECMGEPTASLRIEPRKYRREVVFVFGACSLGLEEENDLRPPVRDPFLRSLDQALIGHADLTGSSADPGLTRRGLAEDVKTPKAGRRLSYPRLMRIRIRGVRNRKCGDESGRRSAGREELEPLQNIEHLRTACLLYTSPSPRDS